MSTAVGTPAGTSTAPRVSDDRHTITASTYVPVPPERVWAELLHPGARWMLGANIGTDFQVGSPITFEGHFFGRTFEDHGIVLGVKRARMLRFTHFSPAYGIPDMPENYHDITITLTPAVGGTLVEVIHHNISTADRAANAAFQWKKALATIAHSDSDAVDRLSAG